LDVEIVVTYLTRMAPPRMCVAGLEPDTGVHARPVPRYGRLEASDLRSRGGVFGLASSVDLGAVVPRPSPPESEDVLFSLRAAGASDPLSGEEFWALLERSSEASLGEIFGPGLVRDGHTASMEEAGGPRSLGHLRPRGQIKLELSFGKAKLHLADPDLGALRLPVTDLRLFDPDTGELQEQLVGELAGRIERCETVLAVGLSRPWAPDDGELPRHWLQVNNVHLDGNPLWLA
jgi:hypothetical protein